MCIIGFRELFYIMQIITYIMLNANGIVLNKHNNGDASH